MKASTSVQNEGGRPENRAPQPTLRAGARRLEAYRRGAYSVPHTADARLSLPEVDRARAGRPIRADVGPFVQDTSVPADASRVADGGEAVARALAQQLDSMGWLVRLFVPGGEKEASLKIGGRGRRPGRQREPIHFTFRGAVEFYVSMIRDTAQGTLRGTVEIADAAGAPLLSATPGAVSRVTKGQEPLAVGRVKRAEREALAGFVRALLANPKLSAALVRSIKSGR